MKKSLIHLPQYKRDELKRIVKIIRRQFPSAHMIILFGSYARGQWVENTYTDARYKKDYKITKKQLEYLVKRVKLLQRLTKKICKKKIECFV